MGAVDCRTLFLPTVDEVRPIRYEVVAVAGAVTHHRVGRDWPWRIYVAPGGGGAADPPLADTTGRSTP